MSVPSNIIYYAFYEQFKMILLNNINNDSKLYKFYPLLCGGMARCIEVPLLTPLEVIRIRQQAVLKTSFLKTFKACLSEYQSHGVKVFYRGMTTTLCRDVPFSAIYWQLYENLVLFISNHTKTKRDTLKCSFIAGAISGCLSTLITTPFDVIKTVQQVNTSQNVSLLAVFKHIRRV